MSDSSALEKEIIERLTKVIDPETGLDVIRMRLIEDLIVGEDGVISYKFHPSSPFCPIAVPLSQEIQAAVAEVPGVTGQTMEIIDLFLDTDLAKWLNEAMNRFNK